MAVRSDEKLKTVGVHSKFSHREDAGGGITKLNAFVLLAEGLKHGSQKLKVTLFTDVAALVAGRNMKET